jgi:hypothetical protein
MPKHHDIKIHPQHFRSVQANEMPFQIRFNDRDYQAGDTLTMKEWKPDELGKGGKYSGLEIHRVINHVFDELPGLQSGFVAFSIRKPISS